VDEKSCGGITILDFGATGNTDKWKNTAAVAAHSLPMCVIDLLYL